MIQWYLVSFLTICHCHLATISEILFAKYSLDGRTLIGFWVLAIYHCHLATTSAILISKHSTDGRNTL